MAIFGGFRVTLQQLYPLVCDIETTEIGRNRESENELGTISANCRLPFFDVVGFSSRNADSCR